MSASTEPLQKLERVLFPGGQQDVDRMTNAILAVLPGKFHRTEAEQLGRGIKAINYMSEARGEERLLAHLRPRSPTLTDIERLSLIRAVVDNSGRVTEGNVAGSSSSHPIVIKARNSFEGIDAEYRNLERLLGPENKSWTLHFRAHGTHGARYLEWFVVNLKSGGQRTIYFDITSFFGKL